MSGLAAALVAAWAGPAAPVWDGETVRLGTYDDYVVAEVRPITDGQVSIVARMPGDVAVRLVAYLAALRDETAGVQSNG